MVEDKGWEKPFQVARDAVQRGDFDEAKKALESVGFEFYQTKDPNHWMYLHPALKDDPHFRYPRNLYRPHGSRRSTDRITRHDQSQAKQVIEALRVLRASQAPNGETQK